MLKCTLINELKNEPKFLSQAKKTKKKNDK